MLYKKDTIMQQFCELFKIIYIKDIKKQLQAITKSNKLIKAKKRNIFEDG